MRLIAFVAALALTAPASIAQGDSLRIARLEVESARTSQTLDSLNSALASHRIAEDFYNTALDEQANRFSLIVGIIITVIGLISYGSIKLEINRKINQLKDIYSKHEAKTASMESQILEDRERMNLASGNLNVVISDIVKDDGYIFSAASFRCLAAGFLYQKYKLSLSSTRGKSTKYINSIKNVVKENLDDVLVLLNEVDISDNHEVDDILEDNGSFEEAIALMDGADLEIEELLINIKSALIKIRKEAERMSNEEGAISE
jgi:uncharacterized coiled-coil protein SlyX